MAIIIPENVVYQEEKVEGNLNCPICTKHMIISGFMGQYLKGKDEEDTGCWIYTYCPHCDKYFKSVPTDKETKIDNGTGLKCPTCENTAENLCCSCGRIIPLEEQKLEPNPYANDIHGDKRLHLECENCKEQSAQDI